LTSTRLPPFPRRPQEFDPVALPELMASWLATSRTTHRKPAGVRPGSELDALLLRVVDGCLAAVVFVAPLVLGGRHDLGRLVFVALAAVGAAACFLRNATSANRAPTSRLPAVLFGLAASLLILQLTPLPVAWLRALAPRTLELLPLWSGAQGPGALGTWTRLSLNPEATRLALAMLAAYGLLFATVAQRVRSEADVLRLVKWIGLSASVMAAIGLVQFAAGTDKFLGIYEHPSREAHQRLSGAFANRNHFAHFLALGVPALAAWLTLSMHSATSSPRRSGGQRVPLAIGAALALVAGAALLSCSRGGVLALGVAATVVVVLLHRAGLLAGKRGVGLVAAGAAVLLGVSLVGYDQLAQRLESLTTQSLDEIDGSAGRRKIWQANVAAIVAGGWFGAGAGAHEDVYPLYLADPPTKNYTHAESGYLQVLTENGYAGGALLAAALLVAAWACLRAVRRAGSPVAAACASACIAALAASAAHSVCDFVWYIPACLSLTLVYAACAVRLGELQSAANAPAKPQSQPPAAAGAQQHSLVGYRRRLLLPPVVAPRVAGLPAAAAALLVGLLAVAQFCSPAAASFAWDAYLRMQSANRAYVGEVLARGPAATAQDAAHTLAAEQAAVEAMIARLDDVICLRPSFEPAHRALAKRCVQLFDIRQQSADNPMSASQIRDAAVASQFRSAAELDAWLARAVGPNRVLLSRAWRHARRAAALAPLQGDDYLKLAELGFLRGQGYAEADAYVHQALAVRPYDGELLLEVGRQWAGRGIVEPALACWSRAIRIEGPHRIVIARCVAGQIPVAAVIADFAPEWDTLPEFWQAVRAGAPSEVRALLMYAEQQTQREAAKPQAPVLWRRLAQMEAEAGLPDRALAILVHAAQRAPQDYPTRRALGAALLEAGRHSEATQHLQWCLERQPSDAHVRKLAMTAARAVVVAHPPQTSETITR